MNVGKPMPNSARPQRTDPGDRVVHGARRGRQVRQRRKCRREDALVVVGDDIIDQTSYGGPVLDRVQTAAEDQFAHVELDCLDAAGPMCRTVQDCALLLQALVGFDGRPG
jgi:hypothetical protein